MIRIRIAQEKTEIAIQKIKSLKEILKTTEQPIDVWSRLEPVYPNIARPNPPEAEFPPEPSLKLPQLEPIDFDEKEPELDEFISEDAIENQYRKYKRRIWFFYLRLLQPLSSY